MWRVLDLDLDFFVHGAAHGRNPDGDRLASESYPPWRTDEAMEFLEIRCGLSGPLPGIVVENHGEAFALWRNEIEAGTWPVPFRITHVDAHADLGHGDSGFLYLMGELLHARPSDRTHPWGADHPVSPRRGLGDGNFLAFAAACRWLSELDYVFNDEGGDDVPKLLMEDFDVYAAHLELKASDPRELNFANQAGRNPPVLQTEPKIPFHQLPWRDFHADSGFDAITLCRSPAFTPKAPTSSSTRSDAASSPRSDSIYM